MWKHLSVGKKLGIGFALVIALALGLEEFAWMKVGALGDQWKQLETVTLKKRETLTAGMFALEEGVRHFRNYIRGGDDRQQFENDMAAILKTTLRYRETGALNSQEDQLLRQVDEGVRNYRAAMAKAARLAGEGKPANEIDPSILGADQVLSDGFRQLLAVNGQASEAALAAMDSSVRTTEAWIGRIGLLTLLLCPLIAWRVVLAITRAPREAAGPPGNPVSYALPERRRLGSPTHDSDRLEADSLDWNAENNAPAHRLSALTPFEMLRDDEVMKDNLEAIRLIAEKINAVNDLAHETHLLALNALIEASRAGIQGKAFALVTVEVSKLAECSRAAAREIGDLAYSSASQAEQAGLLLDEVAPAIRRTADLVQRVAATCLEHSSGIRPGEAAVDQAPGLPQPYASAAEQLAALAAELNEVSKALMQRIAFFRLEKSSS